MSEEHTNTETGALSISQRAAVTSPPDGSVPSEGSRVRRAFMLRQFIPSPDWINVNVVAKGKGTVATLGRIFGVATGFERKVNDVQGRPVESIAVKGIFQAESYLDGIVSDSSIVYFPMAYAERIAAVFEQDASARAVEVDCDIGVEATGKVIPYEWAVTAYREGDEMAVLKNIRRSRGRPATAPALPAPVEALAVEFGGASPAPALPAPEAPLEPLDGTASEVLEPATALGKSGTGKTKAG